MKSKTQTEQVEISGCVNVIGRNSRVISSSRGDFIEKIAPGAFKKALGRAEDVYLLLSHKNDEKLGSIKQGNLKLWEDQEGLKCECIVYHPEIIEKAKKGELHSWSFAFTPLKVRWIITEGVKQRIIKDMVLAEVSILDKYSNPAYPNNSIQVRIVPLNIDNYLSFYQKRS